MYLWLTKVIILTSLLAGSLLFGLLPFKLQSILKNPSRFSEAGFVARVQSTINCFAGGVFFGTTFLELIPEVREGFEEVFTETNNSTDYPVSEFTISIGFFFIVLIEQLMVILMARRRTRSETLSFEYGKQKNSDDLFSGQQKTYGTIPSESKTNGMDVPKHDEGQDSVYETNELPPDDTASVEIKNSNPENFDDQADENNIHSLRTFVLLLALSIHTVFEGLAIGLKNETSQLWSLFAAVFLHKSVISFSLGSQLLENCKSRCRAFVFLFVFCVMSPIGVLIGIPISESNQGNLTLTTTSTVLQAIATGTFVHVTFFEILGRELSNHSKNILKVAMTVLGFGCVALITLL